MTAVSGILRHTGLGRGVSSAAPDRGIHERMPFSNPLPQQNQKNSNWAHDTYEITNPSDGRFGTLLFALRHVGKLYNYQLFCKTTHCVVPADR
jgi:hypothetical protein